MSVEKPKTLAEVAAKMNVTVTPDPPDAETDFVIGATAPFKATETFKTGVIPPDENQSDNGAAEGPGVVSYQVEDDDTAPNETKPIPDWVLFPPNFKVPKGRTVMFIRLRASWTDTPTKGDRVLIAWPITDAEEDLALERSRGKGYRVIPECAKAMIRAVDGKKVQWRGMTTVDQGEVIGIDSVWRDIGAKCRSLLEGLYAQTHRLQEDDLLDFFKNCMATRTVG